MRHVRRHLFHEFLFAYLFFLTLTSYEIIAIFCLLHISCLSVMKINVWHGIEHHNLTHQLTGGVYDSKHAHVPKAIIFTTQRYASRRLCRGRVSVRLSVTFVHSIQMAEDIIRLLCRPGSPIILVF